MPYEHVIVSMIFDLFCLQDAQAMLRHFEAVTIDQQEGLLAGTDTVGRQIIGRPLVTVEEFIKANLSKFVLECPLAASAR